MAISTAVSPLLFEADVRLFLRQAPPSWRSRIFKSALVLSSTVALLIIGFFAINYNAFSAVNTPITPLPTPTVTAAPKIEAAIPQTTPKITTSTPAPAVAPVEVPAIAENTVEFAALGILAPIKWDQDISDENSTNQKLSEGVIHVKGTAKPGQTGFVDLIGHSSSLHWGTYSTIFARLHKAELGQEILINYHNQAFRYQINKIYTVNANDLHILEDGNGNGLRAITCTPLGTSLKRLVVEAKQISPDPAQNTVFTHSIFKIGSVPGNG